MTTPFLKIDGGDLTRDEATAMAAIPTQGFWPPLLRIFNELRSESLTRIMRPTALLDEVNRERGRYLALSELEALLGEEIPRRVKEALEQQSA